jgi:hypothetical protein
MEKYNKVLTAERYRYLPDVEVVDIPNYSTFGQDFYLEAGQLTAAPDPLTATVVIGYDETLQMTLDNIGTISTPFKLFEYGGAFIPPSKPLDGGTITWMYRDADGAEVGSLTDSGAAVAYPGAYRYEPNIPSVDEKILVYTDDWIHTTPNTLVQQALSILGYPATVHVDGDYPGFINSLTTGGPWDVVIWSGENVGVDPALFPALQNYVQGGGKLVATYWRQFDYPVDPLWTEMGFAYISNYVVPPPAYWWMADHSLFQVPENAPEWINRVQNSGNSQGTRLEPLANGIAMAGYTAIPTMNEAGVILRDDEATLYKGIRDVSTNADDDSDGVLDGTELWVNIIYGMVNGFSTDVPWLSEDPITGTLSAGGSQLIDVNFDASVPEVTGPGTYEAELKITSDTPYGVLQIPVTMNVVPVQYGVDAALEQDAQSGTPGTTVTYRAAITNTGNVSDSFDITISGNAWTTTAPVTIGPLVPGESSVVDIDVAIPPDAEGGATDSSTMTLTSQGDPSESASVVMTTTAIYLYGVDATLEQDAQTGTPGTTLTYRAAITNTGNVSDSFDVTITGNAWTTTAPVTIGPLDIGESAVVDIDVAIPSGALDGAMDSANVTFSSQGDPSESDTVVITTTAIHLKLYLPTILKT